MENNLKTELETLENILRSNTILVGEDDNDEVFDGEYDFEYPELWTYLHFDTFEDAITAATFYRKVPGASSKVKGGYLVWNGEKGELGFYMEDSKGKEVMLKAIRQMNGHRNNFNLYSSDKSIFDSDNNMPTKVA